MPRSTASGVESCTVSSSLPIPTRNKQDMQPSSPLGVFSSTPPQFGQVEISGTAGCICSGSSCSHRVPLEWHVDPKTRGVVPRFFQSQFLVSSTNSHSRLCDKPLGRTRDQLAKPADPIGESTDIDLIAIGKVS